MSGGMKERILTAGFLLYVVVLAVGTVDQVFLDSILFPPALDRQLLGMVDVLKDRKPGTVEEARTVAEEVRQHLADIRLEREESELERLLRRYASEGTTVEQGEALLEQARRQAVENLVSNNEFSLGICIRALDPDLALRLWVHGCDDPKVRQGCLEALKRISGQADGFGYDPNADAVAHRESIRLWKNWRREFMEERRRPPQPVALPPVQPPATPATPNPAPKGGAIPGSGAP